MTGEPEFSLIERPWLRVVRAGRPVTVSLRVLLDEAEAIDDLDWGNPLEASAILSLLVAVVKDALRVEGMAGFTRLWAAGRFPDGAFDLHWAEHSSRFDLFHPDHPFFQVGGLEPASGNPKPAALLVPEVATGNNVPIFAAATETSAPALSPADAARRLVACHAWDTAAIKSGAKNDPQVKSGKTTGNPTGAMGQLGVVTLIGRNLFETLMLNLPLGEVHEEDRPAWRAEHDATWASREPLGTLDLYTWQSRRVRLYPVTVDGDLRIPQVLVAAGDRLSSRPQGVEQRTGWNRPDKGSSAVRPRRLRPGRAAWRGLAALLTGADVGGERSPVAGVIDQMEQLVNNGVLPLDHPISVHLVGVEYGNQSAVIEDVISDRTPLPVIALDR
ncbi:type I-E CRISPR-associated protein Cse1/CasA [Knoellia koreensis]|uniref:Type I-E CRISPR-associated protein Cse1/CasA n=1 Tax=Knoellia koreensis TaxID=2730921 RepID=A0A849HGR5_9MICO|nr:type I-E CRISPR-associated protein Cse1/CasA [Knoellia sp. DB2414S]NNM46442.1 type I-E CRISPR-associated protein Cse1/CasA [Knoellia sp. DB2414S]